MSHHCDRLHDLKSLAPNQISSFPIGKFSLGPQFGSRQTGVPALIPSRGVITLRLTRKAHEQHGEEAASTAQVTSSQPGEGQSNRRPPQCSQDSPPQPTSPPWPKETQVLEREKTKQASLRFGLLCRQSQYLSDHRNWYQKWGELTKNWLSC